MIKSGILIFQKNLVAGRTKTRLAATIGDEAALAVYEQLILLTRRAINELPFDKCTYYSEYIPVPDSDIQINDQHFSTEEFIQQGIDLGERMSNAFTEQFNAGYKKLIIIGTDCPDISDKLINQAFDSLDKYDVVIGPAADGGYYLLGMGRLHTSLFSGISWSTPGVSEETIKKINTLQLSYKVLPVLHDLDDEKDLEHFKTLNILS